MRLCGWLEVRGGDNSLLQFILWQFAFKYLSNFEFSWAELRFLWFYCLYFTFTCRPYLLIKIHLFKRQCPKALRLFCMSDTISVMFHWVLHYVKAHTQNYCMYCGLWIFFLPPIFSFFKKYIYIFFFLEGMSNSKIHPVALVALPRCTVLFCFSCYLAKCCKESNIKALIQSHWDLVKEKTGLNVDACKFSL